MSPDDYTNDPDPDIVGVPGTVDDLPDTYGQAVSTDDSAVRASTPKASSDESASVPADDEHELWGLQKPLIEEDEEEGLRLDAFPVEEVPDILGAMGDDAADPLEDTPNGTSATGLWGTPDHGGFPEHSD